MIMLDDRITGSAAYFVTHVWPTQLTQGSHKANVESNALFSAMESLGFPEIPGEFIALLKFDSKLACMGYPCLDIISLDDILQTPDGISLKERIDELYGLNAVRLIEHLIGDTNEH